MAEARTANNQAYSLAASLDLLAAQTLRDDLLERFHGDGGLTISAEAVERISTPCIEVLVATSNAFSGTERKFRVESSSACFDDAMHTLGLTEYLVRWRQT